MPDNAATSVTGRDTEIMLKALLYAVAHIQSLPGNKQEYSDMIEMCSLAREIGGNVLAVRVWSAEYHTAREIDLWPAGGGNEVDGAYTDEEIVAKEDIRAEVNANTERFSASQSALDAPPSGVVKFFGGAVDGEGEAA